MLILNTGGTFNKRYNPIIGELFVPKDNDAVISITALMAINADVKGIIYKDSLEMNEDDRILLAKTVEKTEEKIIIIVHGTDTMDVSADYIAHQSFDKVIVFTGAMVPYSIDPVEAAANLGAAVGFAQNAKEGVYVSMQGIVGPYERVIKNRAAGKFEYV